MKFCQNCGSPVPQQSVNTPKFCKNCGAQLKEGSKFCSGCGATIVPTQQTQASQQAAQPIQQTVKQPVQQQPQAQKQYTQPQVTVPNQFANRNTTQHAKKSGGKGVIAIVAILIVAVIVVVGVFGLRDGGFLRNIGSGSGSKVRSMTEYAKQLEKEGNTEAAAAVYALMQKIRDAIDAGEYEAFYRKYREIFDRRI